MRRETALKIAGLLRKDLDTGLTILEISKRLTIGYRPAHTHVSEMIQEGIIIGRRVGAAMQCRLNLGDSRCRQLLAEVDLLRKEALFKENQKLKSVLESLIAKLSESLASEVHAIVLFGSYAKGTANKSSDIDVLFIISDMKDKSVREKIERECASYEYSHSIKISPLITDITEFRKMLKATELNVGKETREYGIPLYGSEIFWRQMA